MPWSTRFNGLTNQRRVMDADAGKIGGFPPWCRSRRNPFLIQFLCPSSGIKISGCGIPEAAAITVAFSIPVRKKIQGEIWQRRTARFKQIETKKMNNRKKSPGFVEFQAVFVNCSSWWAEPGPDRLLPQNGEKCGRGAALLEQKNAIISNCSTSFSFTLRYFGIFGNEFNELLHISPPPPPQAPPTLGNPNFHLRLAREASSAISPAVSELPITRARCSGLSIQKSVQKWR